MRAWFYIPRRIIPAAAAVFVLLISSGPLHAQQALSWDEVRTRFEVANPTLLADQNSVDELKAAEVTAFLRPNPQVGLSSDGTQIAPHTAQGSNVSHWQPFTATQLVPTISYLHERERKRELRLESAKEATRIGTDLHHDLERNMIFALRTAFVQTLQAKAVLKLAQDDLTYWDKVIAISKSRLEAGDIARIDFQRIDLQRVQYESEVETAIVNLRTAKIQLLQLLNDRTPVDQFDVSGSFDFSETLDPLENFRQSALDARPDLQAAVDTLLQSKTNYKLAVANGSADPTVSMWYSYNPSFNNPYGRDTLGASVNLPLRIFDRNQGEKKRTLIDIDRSKRLTEAARAQVFSDVDAAYEQVRSSIVLLLPYRGKYLDESTSVRETVSFSYEHGGASLMDFLNAQSDYRQVQLAYLQLIGTYLTAAGQLNLAVGREVIR
jgi:cobalt-zinc-cadmium efflux system outer membrane protein